MESTGVYWKPVFNLLEGRFEVMLVNAHRLKQVPGRKTDVKDAEWIAQLLQYGLLSPQLHPAAVDPRAPRADPAADRAGPRPGGGGQPDPQGAGGRQHQAGLRRQRRAGGLGPGHDPGDHRRQEDPDELAGLARRRLRGKIPELKRALEGRVTEHHRFLLRALLEQIESLEAMIARFDARIEQVGAPLDEAARRLRGIPGVGERAAEVILAEVGTDMGQFPTAGHLSSWAGVCPGNDQGRQAAERQDDQGEPVAADDAGAGGVGGEPDQGDGLRRVLSAVGEVGWGGRRRWWRWRTRSWWWCITC